MWHIMFCELHVDFTICSSYCQLIFSLAGSGTFSSSRCKCLSASDRGIYKFIAVAGVTSSGPLNTQLARKPHPMLEEVTPLEQAKPELHACFLQFSVIQKFDLFNIRKLSF